MAEFYFDNLAKNLPDVYRKDANSNNYKILELERAANVDLRSVLDEIASITDIENAKGAVLDMYGKRFGQPRGKASDAQYRTMIKAKIVRGMSDGSYKNITDALCYTFGCTPDELCIKETDSIMSVSLEKAPLDKIVTSGFTTSQAYQIVKSILPVTVELQSVLFEGTFELAANDDEYDEATGLSDAEGSTIGGYLGATESDVDDTVLPI